MRTFSHPHNYPPSITPRQVRERFEYRDGNLWWRVRPSNRVNMNKPAGWISSNGYRHVGIKGSSEVRMYSAHRLVWCWHAGKWPMDQIDHIDGNRLNNEITNLREATNAENQHNRGKKSNNTSGFMGVSWNKNDGRWWAKITIDRRQIHIGRFDCPKEAHAAYCRAADNHHGEFARHG